MDDNLFEYLDEFIKELNQLLEQFELKLEELHNGNYDIEIINEIFRVAHSIKGMSATMQFQNMEALTHRMEDILDKLRNNDLEISEFIVEVLFKGFNVLNDLMESIKNIASEDEVEGSEISVVIAELDQILGKNEEKNELIIEKNDQSTIELDNEIMDEIDKVLENNEQLFFIKVCLEENMSLPSARAFMIINSIKSSENLLTSIPKAEKFRDQNFDFEDTELYLLFTTNSSKEEISERIFAMPDVKNVCLKKIKKVAELNFDFNSSYITPNNDEIHKFSEEDLYKFLYEKMSSLEVLAINFDGDNFSVYFKKIADEFQVVAEGIKRVNNDLLSDLGINSFKMLEICSEKTININDKSIDYFFDVLTLLKKFFERPSLLDNRIFNKKLSEINGNIEKLVKLAEVDGNEKIGEILQKESNLSDEDINNLLDMQKTNYKGKKLGEIAITEKKSTSKEVIDALRVQNSGKNKKTSAQEQIRIPANKADHLIDLLEEAIMVESEIEQDAIRLTDQDSAILKKITKLFRITKEIQNLSISFRMITLHPIFQKVNMSARDAMKKLDKKVKIELSGAVTNIDRLVGNRLVDPLLHIVKNSISHGIESREEREVKGKNPLGHIHIHAHDEKGYVYLSIADDGRGIDPEKVYNKALEKQLIDPNKKYTEDEIINFIFLPGFSTTEKVNKISGRGVGMDVVKTELSKLRGKILIKNRLGKGCTITLKIPQNMTSLNGTVVRIKGNKYIVPSFFIKEVFKLKQEQYVSISNRNSFVKLRENLIPVINRDDFFHGEGKAEIMMILDVENKERAIAIDEVLERREVVVKPLGEDFENIKYILGASILGDGKAALILGVESLFKESEGEIGI